ncbi:MAG: hypothetical protein ACQEP1_02685 [Nanobdellota archaeon]
MKDFKNKVIQSFKLAKNDISRLEQDLILFAQRQEKIIKTMEDLKEENRKLKARLEEKENGKENKGSSDKFVAAKNGKVFFKADSPAAKRIKPENKVTFSTRKEALDKGLRPSKR